MPIAVVFDPNEPLAAQLDVDLDAPRARVDRVFDELFDDRRRTLDDLAGGDLVGEIGGKKVDDAHAGFGLWTLRLWALDMPRA